MILSQIFIPSFLGYLFLALSLLTVWIHRSYVGWASFLVLSLLFLLLGGNLHLASLLIIGGWAVLWLFYRQGKHLLFVLLILLSYGFKFHWFPGFVPYMITPKFQIGMETPLMGLFPLALLVPLARSPRDWKKVSLGTLYGVIGIAVLAGAAVLSHATQWQFKLPTHAGVRYLSNLVFTAIPEEAFYRGFVQTGLVSYLKKVKGGKTIAIVATSLLFTAAHLFWSPSFAILAFVFLASLLYGFVYQISGKIESAILTHFLLNFIHMTFFSYHAM